MASAISTTTEIVAIRRWSTSSFDFSAAVSP